MSNDPADIYITFGEVDFGTGPARQVCAIYVDTPGFVELTLAPVGWDPITGRPPPTPTPVPTEVPPLPSATVSQEDAVAAAREAVPEAADWDVYLLRVGVRVGDGDLTFTGDWMAGLDEGHPIWTVVLWSADRGVRIYIDAQTGEVLNVGWLIC